MIDGVAGLGIGGLSEHALWGTTEIELPTVARRDESTIRNSPHHDQRGHRCRRPVQMETMTAMTKSLRPSEILVGDAMHEGILTCTSKTPLRTVAAMMVEHRVHCIAVLAEPDESYRLGAYWAVVSDLDLAATASLDVDAQTAGGTAASPVVTVTPAETVERAAQLMREYGTSHLVVVAADDNRPLGVISTLDVAAVLARMPAPVAR
jgi:CBS domain-containing protein